MNNSLLFFSHALQRYQAREFNASIYDLQKTEADLQIYITDKNGKVILHTDTKEIGKDYSGWRDVARTLRGEYGARTSKVSPDDNLNTIMFVAAPIKWGQDILGVITVGKPNLSIQPIIELNQNQIWLKGVVLLTLGLVLGLITAFLLTGSIRRLTRYVDAVRRGERVKVPNLHERELDKLALAVDAMRNEIDGKAYVENYILSLTHEMKSPLATIKGASELLEEDMPESERNKFLSNIQNETERLRNFIDRLLQLAAVEKRQTLENAENINIEELIQEQADSKSALLVQKSLKLTLNNQASTSIIQGERFLLKRAISNILDNAIDFAHEQSELSISIKNEAGFMQINTHNHGEPIPDYAKERLFERFYSLPRPDSQQKSTGLGLSFVREVAVLHGGTIELVNMDDGVTAQLTLLIKHN